MDIGEFKEAYPTEYSIIKSRWCMAKRFCPDSFGEILMIIDISLSDTHDPRRIKNLHLIELKEIFGVLLTKIGITNHTSRH